jgi:hypothetical protein
LRPPWDQALSFSFFFIGRRLEEITIRTRESKVRRREKSEKKRERRREEEEREEERE